MRKNHRYTKEQIDYLKKIYPGRPRKESADMFNKKFGTNVDARSVGSVMNRRGIRNYMEGHDTRFKKGHEPWSKDMKGLNIAGKNGRKTQFKKGNVPHSRKPIGYIGQMNGWKRIKVGQPSKWEWYHRYLWEKHFGEIPDDHVVLFKDGNRFNFDLDNLFMVNTKVMTSVVKRNMRQRHPELNLLAHKVAELDLKIKEKSDA